MKKRLGIIIKFLVSGGLIWFLTGRIDMHAAMERLFEVDPKMLAMAISLFFLQLGIAVFRWQVILDAIKAPLNFITALRIYYIGVFFNQTLPSSVGGDAVRIYRTYRVGLSLSNAINSVMLERAATVIALLIVVAATQPFFLHRVSVGSASMMVSSVAILSIAATAGIIFLMMLDRLPESLRHWRLIRAMAALATDTRVVFLRPMNIFKVIWWASIGHLNITLATYLLALGLNLNVTLVDCLALVPPVILITTLPISIAGWGVREGAMVAAFGLIGVPAEGALVLSLLFGLVGIIAGLPGGIVWMTSASLYKDADAKKAIAKEKAKIAI